jgi:hypothetical protein
MTMWGEVKTKEKAMRQLLGSAPACRLRRRQ